MAPAASETSGTAARLSLAVPERDGGGMCRRPGDAFPGCGGRTRGRGLGVGRAGLLSYSFSLRVDGLDPWFFFSGFIFVPELDVSLNLKPSQVRLKRFSVRAVGWKGEICKLPFS